MRVALVNLTRGDLSFGYQKYLKELAPLLRRHPRIKDLVVYAPPKFITLAGDIPCQPCVDTGAGRKKLRESLVRLSPDVIFCPNLRGISIKPIPSVYMIRNMESLARHFWGNCWQEDLKNFARYYSARMVCHKAARVVAVSGYVKDFLTGVWRIPAGKIGVVYHGVNPPAPPESLPIPAGIPPQWAGEFLFTAGSIRPARGLEDLIQALPLLASRGIRVPLVIAGGATQSGHPYYRKMQQLAQKLGVDDLIVWAGQLTPQEMSWCYYHNRLFIMTSRVEACPNVALEAMIHGCLSVVANNPPLPEFFQESCIYYTPRSANSLAEAVAAALHRAAPERQRLQSLAQARGGEFNWQRTAELTVRELEKATGSGSLT